MNLTYRGRSYQRQLISVQQLSNTSITPKYRGASYETFFGIKTPYQSCSALRYRGVEYLKKANCSSYAIPSQTKSKSIAVGDFESKKQTYLQKS